MGMTILIVVALQSGAQAFPAIESFDNDVDAYDPQPNAAIASDPSFSGSPPTAYPWQEVRTGGAGVIEEVPTGFAGITASRGSSFGIVEFASGDGPLGRAASAIAPLAEPWSYQLDLYLDPNVLPGGGIGQGIDGFGGTGVPDFAWIGAVQDNRGEPPDGAYLTETGFTAEALDDDHASRFWRLTTTASGNPFADIPVGQWITLEIKYRADSAGKLTAEHNIFNHARTEMLYSFTPARLFLAPDYSWLGGPLFTTLTLSEPNMERIYIDEVGVGPPIPVSAPIFVLGDMDGDGDRDNFDIQPFELALTSPTGPGGYLAQYPTLWDYRFRGDADGDGDFDNFDSESFEQLLTSSVSGPEAAVPEPGSLVLLVFGAPACLWSCGRKSLARARHAALA